MKSVLISIQPHWCELIARGKKTMEVRKTRPKLEEPFKVFIYCTLPPQDELFTHGGIREYANELIRLQSGEIVYSYGMRLCLDTENRPYSKDNFLCKKVIGEFICDSIQKFDVPYPAYQNELDPAILKESCCTYYQLHRYAYHDNLYGWHISDLKIYDRPKELREFHTWKKCNSCRKTGYERTACMYDEDCMVPAVITRAPQSWCYVEEA